MPPMQPTLLQGIQYIISCNSLLVEGGGNKYKGAGLPLYLAKLVAHYTKKMQFYRTILLALLIKLIKTNGNEDLFHFKPCIPHPNIAL